MILIDCQYCSCLVSLLCLLSQNKNGGLNPGLQTGLYFVKTQAGYGLVFELHVGSIEFVCFVSRETSIVMPSVHS